VGVGVRVGVSDGVKVALGVGDLFGVGVLEEEVGICVDVGEPGVSVAPDPAVGVGELVDVGARVGVLVWANELGEVVAINMKINRKGKSLSVTFRFIGKVL